MDFKSMGIVFATVLVAELGDKTQLATVLFSADKDNSKLAVFIGAAGALVLAAAIGVFAGAIISKFVTEKQLSIIAGIGFIAIGAWTIFRGIR